MWTVTIIGSCIGAIIILTSLSLNSAVQQATAAIGISFAIIPYCIARSLSELNKEKDKNKLLYSQAYHQRENKRCPKCGEIIAKEALNCIFCDHEFGLKEILRQEDERNKLIGDDKYTFDKLSEERLLHIANDYQHNKKDYLKATFYLNRLIKEYPEGHYAKFAQERIDQMVKQQVRL